MSPQKKKKDDETISFGIKAIVAHHQIFAHSHTFTRDASQQTYTCDKFKSFVVIFRRLVFFAVARNCLCARFFPRRRACGFRFFFPLDENKNKYFRIIYVQPIRSDWVCILLILIGYYLHESLSWTISFNQNGIE